MGINGNRFLSVIYFLISGFLGIGFTAVVFSKFGEANSKKIKYELIQEIFSGKPIGKALGDNLDGVVSIKEKNSLSSAKYVLNEKEFAIASYKLIHLDGQNIESKTDSSTDVNNKQTNRIDFQIYEIIFNDSKKGLLFFGINEEGKRIQKFGLIKL